MIANTELTTTTSTITKKPIRELKKDFQVPTLVQNPTPISKITPTLQWGFIQLNQVDSTGNPLVLNMDNDSSSAGNPCIVYPYGNTNNTTTNNELWQLTPDGHIISRLQPSIALDIGSPIANLGVNCYQVVTNPLDPNSNSQKWTVKGNIISNQGYSGLTLGIQSAIGVTSPSAATDDNVVIAENIPSDNVCFNWTFAPSSPLDSILLEPAVPFVQFSGDQATAYTDISLYVSGKQISSIRTQYTNLNAPLSAYKSSMDTMSCPTGVTSSDFTTVKNQLDQELTCAIAIVQLFNNYFQFHDSVFVGQEGTLSQLAGEVGLELTNNTSHAHGWVIPFLSGILYTGLCAIPVASGVNGFGVVANLIQTGINIGTSIQSAGQKGLINPDPFDVELCNLWQTLNTQFVGLYNAIGQAANVILSDWGMMQNTYKLSVLPVSNPNSLFWAPTLSGEALTAAQQGFTISCLQVLMPIQYQIYTWSHIGGTPYAPSWCQWTESTGAKLMFFIADCSAINKFPTQQLMETQIWNNGVSQYEFFKSCFGWNFNACIIQPNNSEFKSGVLNFSNNTPAPLNLALKCGSQTSSGTVATYSSNLCIPYGEGFSVNVTDANNNFVASFDVSVHHSAMKGCTVSYQGTPNVSGSYQLSQPMCVQGSYSNNYTASMGLGISLSNPTTNN